MRSTGSNATRISTFARSNAHDTNTTRMTPSVWNRAPVWDLKGPNCAIRPGMSRRRPFASMAAFILSVNVGNKGSLTAKCIVAPFATKQLTIRTLQGVETANVVFLR